MTTLKTVLRFAYVPNNLGLCGRKDKAIYELLDKKRWTQKEEEKIKNFIKDLKVLYAYLKAIGDARGKPPFDTDVVNACLFGQAEWEGVAAGLKHNLKAVAIPKKLKDINRLPDMPFTHSFHTLYFGAVASDIPKVIEFANKCKVSLGIIEGENVIYNKLNEGLKITKGVETLKSPSIEVSEGDQVFMHHGIVFKKATSDIKKIYEEDFSRVLRGVKKFWKG